MARTHDNNKNNNTAMKKLLAAALSLAALTLFPAASQAQDEPKGKPNVLIDYFQHASNVSGAMVETIRNAVMDGIQQTNRVNLIDVDSKSTLRIEREIRESENASAGDNLERLALMQQEASDYLLQGTVTEISFQKTESKSSSGTSVSYDATIVFSLKTIDPKTGKITYTETFKYPTGLLGLGGTLKSGTTPEEALSNYTPDIKKAMKKFVDKAFPLEAKVLDLSDMKGDECKTLYINIGSEHGIAKGAKLEVREERIIAGRTSRKNIGEIEVLDVEGDDLSLCKVKKGGKEIAASFRAGNTLVVNSLQK